MSQRHETRLRVLVASLALAIVGCASDDFECGPPRYDGHLQSTTYQSDGNGEVIKGAAFIHDPMAARTLTYDESSGVMTISYMRDGKQIVETYRRR